IPRHREDIAVAGHVQHTGGVDLQAGGAAGAVAVGLQVTAHIDRAVVDIYRAAVGGIVADSSQVARSIDGAAAEDMNCVTRTAARLVDEGIYRYVHRAVSDDIHHGSG